METVWKASRPAGRVNWASPLLLYACFSACLLEWFVLAQEPAWALLGLGLGYGVLILCAVQTVRRHEDVFNPLVLVLLLGFVRFGLPGILGLLFEWDLPEFRLMGLGLREQTQGHILAVMGLLGFVLGWTLPAAPLERAGQRLFSSGGQRLPGGVHHAAILGMCAGFAALLLFITSNATLEEVILSGEFRATAIRVGTGKYFYLSLLLISSSVVYAGCLARQNRAAWIVLLPTLGAMAAFAVLGGRARALTAVAAGLVILWYRRRDLRMSARTLGATLVLALLVTVSFSALLAYRGGEGSKGFERAASFTGVLDYLQWAVWVDLGQLHSLAGATLIGPGVLEGQSFFGLLWPLTEWMKLPGRSAGIFLVETLVGFGAFRWGYHPSLIGDAYLNFGSLGVLVITGLCGMLLRSLYVVFRRCAVNSAVYALATVYALRVFFESIDKYSEMVLILGFAFLLLGLGRFLTHVVVGYAPAVPAMRAPMR